MVSSQIILSGITTPDLIELFRVMVKDVVSQIKDKQEEKLLSPAETCKIFQPTISKVTLASWTNKGLLQDHRIGGRVFYKQSEVLAKLIILKKYKN